MRLERGIALMKKRKMIVRIFIILIIIIVAVVLIGLLFLKYYPSIGKLPDEEQKQMFSQRTNLYYDNQFHNENEVPVMTGEEYPSSPRKTPKTTISAMTPTLIKDAKDDDLTYTWIGHSSFILQLGEINILVDPVLSERSSPVSFAGSKRFSELPITTSELPKIDVLLLSHDHYDHMDYKTIKDISSRVGVFIVPLGVDSILRGWGIEDEKIVVLDWWEHTEVSGTVITLTPSQHYTGRNPLKINSTYWGGYYLDNGKYKVYYTGDGGYYDVFSRVRERLGSPDLMIAECGQYDTAWAKIHMFPEETVQAAVDVNTKWLIPVHWGTFCICNHAWDDPIIRVTAKAAEIDINIATPRIGQTVNYENIDSFNESWWEEYE